MDNLLSSLSDRPPNCSCGTYFRMTAARVSSSRPSRYLQTPLLTGFGSTLQLSLPVGWHMDWHWQLLPTIGLSLRSKTEIFHAAKNQPTRRELGEVVQDISGPSVNLGNTTPLGLLQFELSSNTTSGRLRPGHISAPKAPQLAWTRSKHREAT